MSSLVPDPIAPAMRFLSGAPSEVAVAVFVGDLIMRVAAISAVRPPGGPIGVVVHA